MSDLGPLFKDEEHGVLFQEIRKLEQGLWRVRIAFASLPISVISIFLSILLR